MNIFLLGSFPLSLLIKIPYSDYDFFTSDKKTYEEVKKLFKEFLIKEKEFSSCESRIDFFRFIKKTTYTHENPPKVSFFKVNGLDLQLNYNPYIPKDMDFLNILTLIDLKKEKEYYLIKIPCSIENLKKLYFNPYYSFFNLLFDYAWRQRVAKYAHKGLEIPEITKKIIDKVLYFEEVYNELLKRKNQSLYEIIKN
jgi:hypothetical protein